MTRTRRDEARIEQRRAEADRRQAAYNELSLEEKYIRALERGHSETREAKRLEKLMQQTGKGPRSKLGPERATETERLLSASAKRDKKKNPKRRERIEAREGRGQHSKKHRRGR